MSDSLSWIITYGDKLGIASLLIIAVVGLVVVVRRLYKDRIDCDEARLQTTMDIGELKGALGSLEMKVEMQEKQREQHIHDLERLHRGVLEAVVKHSHD